MPASALSSLSSRSFIFIDANIFVYGLSGQSGECRQFLDRCLREEVTGITLFDQASSADLRFEVRGSYLVIIFPALYSGAVSRLRRPFLSDRYFFITVRLLKERAKLLDADFRWLALAFNRARVMHSFLLTACVFLPDPAATGHAICAPVCPLTISLVMRSVKTSSMILMNRRRAQSGELWQARLPSLRSGQASIVPCAP